MSGRCPHVVEGGISGGLIDVASFGSVQKHLLWSRGVVVSLRSNPEIEPCGGDGGQSGSSMRQLLLLSCTPTLALIRATSTLYV